MPNGHGFSFPYGAPMLLYPLLMVAIAAGAGRWWGTVLAFVPAALAIAFTWEGCSRSEYEGIHKTDPTLNRTTWVINWLLFFALPGYLITLVALAKVFGTR
jgi:hypothetical protein